MAEPLVTVAIPSYNRPGYLREALESVLAQEFQDFAVLVSDDASPNDVSPIIQSFHDPRIHLVRQPRRLGMLRNWRSLLSAPKTRYVANLDDDDLWLPHHLSRAVAALEVQSEATFYSCAAQMFGAKQDIIRLFWSQSSSVELWRWQDTGYAVWLFDNPVQSSSIVIRRAALEGLFWGGQSWPWCHDWLWWGQLALRGPFLFNPEVGAKYRRHDTNATGQYRDLAGNRDRAQFLYTIRELATRAWQVGALRDLVAETKDFPASSLSVIVIALTAPETPPGLARQAWQIFERRRDLVHEPGCARNYRLAAALGGWWLATADIRTRLAGRWWPAPAW